MISGPHLEEREIFGRIHEVLQTYETGGGRARYRTAVLVAQPEPRLLLDGEEPAALLWLVDADSVDGTEGEVRGYDSLEAARRAGVEWLGIDRPVSLEEISSSALTRVMSDIQGIAWR